MEDSDLVNCDKAPTNRPRNSFPESKLNGFIILDLLWSYLFTSYMAIFWLKLKPKSNIFCDSESSTVL